MMKFRKEVDNLVSAGVLDQDAGQRIREYYDSRTHASSNRLITLLGILGAVLIGLGIILVVAHNWDELTRFTRTVLAFAPLLIGQGLTLYTILKKRDSVLWREASASFLFLAIGVSMGLVSQIYHIPGNFASFLLTWMLLGLPLVYVPGSSVVSVFYMAGISFYIVDHEQDKIHLLSSIGLWLLILPQYLLLLKSKPQSNFTIIHNWVVPIGLSFSLAGLTAYDEVLLATSYISLFTVFSLIGSMGPVAKQITRNNGMLVIGWLGIVIMFIAYSFFEMFPDVWGISVEAMDLQPQLYVASAVTLLAVLLLGVKWKRGAGVSFIDIMFILFIGTFLAGTNKWVYVALMNLWIIILGISTIISGVKRDHLGIVNLGLMILVLLGICRFFDEQISFVIRGSAFIVVGIGFFMLNSYIIKKRRSDA